MSTGRVCFLAGIKDSNLFIFLLLLVFSAYIVIRRRLYRLRVFKITLILGVIVSFITLFSPYLTNVVRYQAIDYPFNQKVFADNLDYENIPLNIRHDGKLKLFYYGIFSSAQSGNAQDSSSNAHLKIPFTTSVSEFLDEASSATKLVGGYGVFFSGIFLVSVGAYIYLAIRRKTKNETKVFKYLSLILVLIIVSCLLGPQPNYPRFESQLDLFPVAIIVTLLILSGNKWRADKVIAIALIVLLSFNIIPDIILASRLDARSFNILNSQLSSLHASDKTYLVYPGPFYSDIVRLRSHDIKIVVSQKPIQCSHMLFLDGYFVGNKISGTEMCALT